MYSPFGIDWWLWLCATGFSLGCVLSVKWVGLFAIAVVGLHTLDELWTMFGDTDMPVVTCVNHIHSFTGCLFESLACSYCWIDYYSNQYLRFELCASFRYIDQFWTW